LKAKDLAAMDKNGKSDPFCKISCNFSSQAYQTHTIYKTLEPVWNESFPIFAGTIEPSHVVIINLFDRDFVGQDFLGSVEVSLAKLINSENDYIESWEKLEKEPTKNYNKEIKKPGQIQIKIHYPKGANERGIIKRDNPKKFYKFEKFLGSGAFGEVRKCVDKKTKTVYAVKILRKNKLTLNSKNLLEREIAVMSKLHHPNIVQMIEAFDTTKKTYLILELITGGELFDEIIARDKPYFESDCIAMVLQILRAISYMNSMGIAHRDLKPENILLDKDHNIKISDFGLSKDFSSEAMSTSCGTPTYVAPEVLLGSVYDVQCDVWSLGVITYILLSSHIPFDGDGESEVFERILSACYSFPSPLWDPVSAKAKDFIAKIFVVEPKQRMTADECLDHQWLAGERPANNKPLPSSGSFAKFQESQRALKLKEKQGVSDYNSSSDSCSDDDDDDELLNKEKLRESQKK
jgi:calcium-dependent protein kinase